MIIIITIIIIIHKINNKKFNKILKNNNKLLILNCSCTLSTQNNFVSVYLDNFSDAVNTVSQQTLHAPVIIHVISMPDAHEQYVRRETWDSVRHGTGIHVSDKMLNNFVFIFACELNHATHFLF